MAKKEAVKKEAPKKEAAKKVKKEEAPEASLFSKALALLAEEHGTSVLESLNEMKAKPIRGVSTGSLTLDYIINPKHGGMVKGQVIELYGPYSSGKTTIALGLVANCTANKQLVIYIDAEGSLRPDSVERAGVDPKYFFRVKDDVDTRDAANMVLKLMKTGEVGMVVIDSIASWKPEVEAKKGKDAEDADFTKPKVALAAAFVSEVLPTYAKICRAHDITLVVLNQVRKNMNKRSMHSPDTQGWGGEVLKHVDSVRIKCTGKVTNNDDKILSGDKLVGQYTTCTADKNKTHIPMGIAKIPLFLGIGVNPYMELARLSQTSGVVAGSAGNFKWADTGESLGVRGIDAFTQRLFDDQEFYLDLRNKVIAKLGICYQEDQVVVNPFHDQFGNKRELTLVEIDPTGGSAEEGITSDDE